MLSLLGFLGCITQKVDRFTLDRILVQGQAVADTQKACALGESLSHVLMATGNAEKQPHLALVISNATAGICAEKEAWEYELQAEKAKKNIPIDTPYRIAEIKDNKIQAERWHALAAQRFFYAYKAAEAEYGEMGGDCPAVKDKDETAFLVALMSGTLAILHDKSSGGAVGVPLDLLPKIARTTDCFSAEKWWHVTSTLKAGIWASIPGTGPEDVDGWKLMVEEAKKGQASGVRAGWGVAALLSNNAGKEDVLREVLTAHGQNIAEMEQSSDWAFFDSYGYELSQQQSDLLWMKEMGYRTPKFGDLPQEEAEDTLPVNGEDPFGGDKEDPFQ